MTWKATGPFETEGETRDAAGWQDVDVDPTDNERWREARKAAKASRIRQVLDRTATPVGAYDKRLLTWVTTWEPEVIEVIAGLIERAYEQGVHDAHGDMRDGQEAPQ